MSEQSAAFPDDHLQAASTSGIVLVNLEMLCQFPDAVREDRDLDLSRTSILLVLAKLLDRLRLRSGVQSLSLSCKRCSQVGFEDDLPLLRPASALNLSF